MKQLIYRLINFHEDSRSSKMVALFISGLIIMNIAAMILETVPEYHKAYGRQFHMFEMFSVLIFCCEYLLRFWSCTVDKRYSGWLRGRLKFMRSPLALIDLLAILPALTLVPGLDLRFLRVMRVFRIIRLLKLARYSAAIQTMGVVLRSKFPEVVISIVLGLVLLVGASSLMYFVEHQAQPDKFSSIPETMWWAVATLTTVGYGDVFPITPLGKLLGSLVAVLGVGMFALPAGIIASGFAEAVQRKGGEKENLCPHCGQTKKPAA